MNKKNKILIVGPDLSLPSGVAHHVKTLISSPLSDNFKLDYFRVGMGLNDNPITLFFRFILTPFRFLWKIWKFWPDVVHLNPSFDSKSLLRELNLIILSKLHRRSTLVQFHGGNLSNFEKNGHIPTYVKIFFKLATHFVLLTHIQKQPLLKYCDVSKMSIIPNMIDTRIFLKKNPKQNARYKILYMSKIESQKGLFDVLESIKLVLNKFSNAKFLFAGDGPDKEKAKLLCSETGIKDSVKFLGYLKDQKKINFLCNGDIFLFPSHYQEGMPYALLEAMAAGLPVIASSTGGVTEIIEQNKNGFLIQPQEPNKLAQAINSLLKDQRLREELGKTNRFKAETEYDIKVVSKKFNKLYQKLSIHS